MKNEISVTPLVSVGRIKFGMNRSDVRQILGGDFVEFRKSKFSKNTSDDFHFLHVYYDVDDKCIAVELFDDLVIKENDVIIPMEQKHNQKWLCDLDKNAEITENDAISQKLSIGISYIDGKVDSILFGRKGYYE